MAAEATETTTRPIANEFVPDSGGRQTTDAGTMLGAAYIAFWLLLLGFVALTWRRQGLLSSRLSRIERALGDQKG